MTYRRHQQMANRLAAYHCVAGTWCYPPLSGRALPPGGLARLQPPSAGGRACAFPLRVYIRWFRRTRGGTGTPPSRGHEPANAGQFNSNADKTLALQPPAHSIPWLTRMPTTRAGASGGWATGNACQALGSGVRGHTHDVSSGRTTSGIGGITM